jgi:hypothetical protein
MPSELWVSYKSSSKYVAEFAKSHGSPSITQVRKTFHTKDAARLWEHKVLKKLKVVNDEKWLNRTDNKAIVPRKGEEHHNATRRGKDSPFYGIARPEVAELKRKEWTKKNPMHNPESKEKSISKRSGEAHHMKRQEVKEKVSGKNNWIYKHPGALEKRRQQFIEMNTAKRGVKYQKLPCPYCNVDMPKNNFKRHVRLCKDKDFT